MEQTIEAGELPGMIMPLTKKILALIDLEIEKQIKKADAFRTIEMKPPVNPWKNTIIVKKPARYERTSCPA